MTEQEEIEDKEFEDQTERQENIADINEEIADEYGSPMPEEKVNQFKIISDAIKRKDTLKTTYLSKQELGLPTFSTRFYLDCAMISEKYNAQLIKEYFLSKIKNITNSGMSNEGFTMKLAVTAKRDVTRKNLKRFNEADSSNEETKGET